MKCYGNCCLLVSQVFQKVTKNFEGLYTNIFTLRGQELVDYPGKYMSVQINNSALSYKTKKENNKHTYTKTNKPLYH